MSEPDERASRDDSRWQWVAGAVAVALAAVIVAGLVFVRLRTAAQPAASGHQIGTLSMTSQLDFHCVLPVQAYGTQARVTMPDGGVTADHVQVPAKGAVNTPGSSYAAGRWLPVPIGWVSADGRWYAYIASTTGVPGQPPTATLFAHDVTRNADRKLWSGSGYSQMIGWGPGGVYFDHQASPAFGGPPSMELWVVDPGNPGSAHRLGLNSSQEAANAGEYVPTLQAWTQIAGGAAWTVSIGPVKVGPPGGAVIPTAPSRVIRMDLKDGSLSTWFTAPDGTGVSILAFDQHGHPVVTVSMFPKIVPQPVAPGAVPPAPSFPPPPRVLLLTGPNETVEIANGSDPAFRPIGAIGDSHGVWFTSPGALWLYRQGTLSRVADVPAAVFPPPPPPSNLPSPPPNVTKLSPPPGIPTGVPLSLAGPCQ